MSEKKPAPELQPMLDALAHAHANVDVVEVATVRAALTFAGGYEARAADALGWTRQRFQRTVARFPALRSLARAPRGRPKVGEGRV